MAEINLQTDVQEFLFYSYFGETWDSLKWKKESKKESNKKSAIYVCFQRAYRDFCRTLSFEKKDGDFPRVVYNQTEMADKIEQLITLPDSQKAFDDRHRKICDKIVESANGVTYLKKKFYYGQAQKWLNMTLKYMALVDLWSEEFTGVKEYLHVPLDRIILKALFNEDIRKYIDEGLIEKEKAKNYVNSEGAIHFKKCADTGSITKDSKLCEVKEKGVDADYVTWSKIPYYEMYMKVQKAVKDCIPNDPKTGEKFSPLDWENKIWLAEPEAEAKSRKEKNET